MHHFQEQEEHDYPGRAEGRKTKHLLVTAAVARVVARVAGGELAACYTPPTALGTELAVAIGVFNGNNISNDSKLNLRK